MPVLAAIHGEAFRPMDERPWGEADLRELAAMPGASLKLALYEHQPAGFILYRAVADEAELITVALFANFQGKGIAHQLMKAMISHLKDMNVAKIFLEVREDNHRAIGLYHRFGFKNVGIRSGYYQTQSGKRFNALCLCLLLNNSELHKEK